MLKAAKDIAGKDIRLLILRGGGIVHSLLLGLLLIFMFSLSRQPGQIISPQSGAVIFWLSSAFCLVLAANMVHSLEENNMAKAGLILMPKSVQAVFFGKAISIFLMLILAQIIFLPATIAFLEQSINQDFLISLLGILIIDLGLAIIGSLLGALSQSGKESLLSLVIFPLIIPLLLAGIKLIALGFGEIGINVKQWMSLAISFDAVFLALALVIFPFIYTSED